jgi:hydroxyacylglutathione hydrolase
MIFKQFVLETLGHASYLIGSEQTGEAMVLDVRRDVDQYYRYAQQAGLRIGYAADTHQHNDFLTGITELRQRSTLELLAGARAELGYQARRLADGDRFTMGEVELETLFTPGPTPEHVAFVLRDHGRGAEPLLLLSGGALLVDDVARPDLLGTAEATRQGVHDLQRTLIDKILPLPDHVMVFPTHVAGSLGGGSIGSMLFTTIGYERRMNRMLQCIVSESEFASRCIDLSALPTVPPYWRRMRGQNQRGPAPLGVLAEPPPLTPATFSCHIQNGAIALDCRPPEAFGSSHIPHALNVGLGKAFATRAGTVLPPDRPILLVLNDPGDLIEATWQLLRIGYEVPAGWLAGEWPPGE